MDLATSQPKQTRPRLSRRGFFFTVMALVLVSFIFISIQLWAQAQSQEEARMAERFRIEGLNTALGMVSNETLTRFANISAIYAVNRLATAIEDYPSCQVRGIKYCTDPDNCQDPNGPFPDGTYYLNASLYDLMVHGSTAGYLTTDGNNLLGTYGDYHFYDPDATHFEPYNLSYSGDEAKYSMTAFFNRTRSAVRLLGYDVQWGDVGGFTFNQTDPWTLQVNLTVEMNFTDSRGWVHVSRRMPIAFPIRIDGFTDPSVLRADEYHRGSNVSCQPVCRTNNIPLTSRPHRNVYRALDANDNPIFDTPTDAQAILLKGSPVGGTYEGLGYFFGPVTTLTGAQFVMADNFRYNVSRMHTYIFMTDSPDVARQEAGNFGGIILNKEPTWFTSVPEINGNCKYTNHTQANCLFCIRYQEVNDTARCTPQFNAFVMAESIPDANPNIPWIATNGDPTSLMPPEHNNYHLGLPEVLISSEINANDLCGPNLATGNRDCKSPTTSPDPLERKQSLEINGYSASKIWDLTGPRDMALCGFYVKSANSASYSQRFTYFWPQFDQSQYRYSRLNFGIESFVVGKWAGGAEDGCAIDKSVFKPIETFSRLDYQFYADDYNGAEAPICTGAFVKGLPGCKNAQDCNNPNGPLLNGTGRFALSNPDLLIQDRPSWPTYRYNVDNLSIYTTTNPGTSQCR